MRLTTFTLVFLLTLAGCKGVKEWEEALTWRSPTSLCTGRIRAYPELIKQKQGPPGSQTVRYGAEMTIRLEC